MLLQALPHYTSTAKDLRTLCATTPGMNSYQPVAASAVEVCAAAKLVKTHKAEKLAAHVVDRTASLINGMVHVPLSQEIIQSLEIFEQKLDDIRRHIEQMPVRSGKKAKFLLGYKFKREGSRLKAELESHINALLATCGKPPASSGISRSDCILELASLSTRAAGAICEAPVLNFLKPVVGIAALICDTAKSVKSNRDAALDLAKHASAVTKCIVERASSKDGTSITKDGEALEALKLALEDVQSYYLTFLQNRRRRVTSWILANQDKDRFVGLNAALDKALAMFSATKILSVGEDMRVNTHTISTLVATVGNVDRKLTIMHADLANLECPIQAHGSAGEKIKTTAFVPFLPSSQLTVFFFRS